MSRPDATSREQRIERIVTAVTVTMLAVSMIGSLVVAIIAG